MTSYLSGLDLIWSSLHVLVKRLILNLMLVANGQTERDSEHRSSEFKLDF